MPAIILAHPHSKVMFDAPPHDPRDPEVLSDEQFAVLDAQDAIERLAARLGSYERLASLVRNIATFHGEKV